MAKLPEIIPITALRHDPAGVLARVRESAQPVIITQRGRAAGVLLSPEAYERAERQQELLRLLAAGELDLRDNRGAALDEVMAQADKLLGNGK